MKQIVSVLICVLLSVSLKTSIVGAEDPGFAPALTDDKLFACDFESGECGMQIAASSKTKFTWSRLAGPTASLTTGPDFDHTTNTTAGFYMYTEATEHEPGEVTSLTISASSLNRTKSGTWPDACLTFWYNMYGQHIGTLNVTVGGDNILWSLSFNQSYGWYQQNVTLKNYLSSNPAQPVSFIGVRGGNEIGQPFGDIAIDDVIIYAGSCGYEVTTAAPTTETPTTTAAPTTIATTTRIITTAAPTTAMQPTTMTATTEKITTQAITATIQQTTASVPVITTAQPTSSNTMTTATITTQATTKVQQIVLTSQTSDVVTTGTVTSESSESSTEIAGSTPKSEGQVASSSDKAIWSLSERDLIILLAILCAAILLLIIIVVVLACCLCLARRKYIVERTANMYPSSSTIDRVSTVESHPAASRDGYMSPYDKATDRHY